MQYEHDVSQSVSLCRFVCLLRWWTVITCSAMKSRNRYMTGEGGALATCMPKPTRIVISCSDVKRGQFLEAEAEAEDKFSESKDNL